MSDTNKKETSQRRKDASRAKGAKSHGPVTPEGKARSSQNAITDGLQRIQVRTEEERVEIDAMVQDHCARFCTAITPSTGSFSALSSPRSTIFSARIASQPSSIFRWPKTAIPSMPNRATPLTKTVKPSPSWPPKRALDRAERLGRSYASQADRPLKMLMELRKLPLPPPDHAGDQDPAGQPDEDLRNDPSPINGHPGAQLETPLESEPEPAEAVDYERPQAPPAIVRCLVHVHTATTLRKPESSPSAKLESVPPAAGTAHRWRRSGWSAADSSSPPV